MTGLLNVLELFALLAGAGAFVWGCHRHAERPARDARVRTRDGDWWTDKEDG